MMAPPVSARNLVRTPLSDELEARVKARVALEWERRGRRGLSEGEVADTAGISVRVLSSWRKTFAVELSDEVLRALRYPASLTANSVAVCVFQRLHGCDVLLYAMCVQQGRRRRRDSSSFHTYGIYTYGMDAIVVIVR